MRPASLRGALYGGAPPLIRRRPRLASAWWWIIGAVLIACDTQPAHEPPHNGDRYVNATRVAPLCEHPVPSVQCSQGFCRVEPGCFLMGVPRSEYGAGTWDEPVQVTLSRPFLMGRTEVTRKLWLSLGWSLPEQTRTETLEPCSSEDCPVGNVTFFDAISFANELSASQGLPPCYSLQGCTGDAGRRLDCSSVEVNAPSIYECAGFRLPTEAEWEYASRAGTTTAFYGGDITHRHDLDCHGEPALESVAWYCGNSGGQTHPVALKSANAWGLHDMLGNVWEYCNDLMDFRGYGSGPWKDPAGTLTPGTQLVPKLEDDAQAMLRVVRGGSASQPALLCKAGTRHFGATVGTDSSAGFRLARSLER